MVAKLLGGVWATAVISGLELGVGLHGNERDGKVIVQIGTGLAVSAGGAAVFASTIAAGALAPAAGAILLVALLSAGIGSFVATGYEELVPESPRDKIDRYG